MAEFSSTPMSSIFNSGITPASESPAAESSDTEKSSDESPESTSPTDKPDVKTEEVKSKPDDTPAADDKKKADKAGEKKDESAEKKDLKSAKDADKKDEKSEDPYEKRWKDTATWANKEHQEKLQLQAHVNELSKHIDILQKKYADPDYDPANDPKYKGPSNEDIAEASVNVGKALASRTAAYEMHGKEMVDVSLGKFKELFGENQMIQRIVLDAEAPAFEAMKIVDRYEFEQKYGNNPKAIHAAIKKETETELRKALRKEILDEITAGGDKRASTPTGLSGSRGSNGVGDKSKASDRKSTR